jgi:predicted Ser/Thr protein kinase
LKIQANKENEPVLVKNSPDELQCIGIGTDAAVFRNMQVPSYAFKVFADDKKIKMVTEQQVYKQLGETHYFPTCFGSGSNYLVLSYEKGMTLYDCLIKGIHIPKQVIQDVEDARAFVYSKGLNPRDIHLKNILMHENRGKLIDVSEYRNPGNDMRWDYLKKGYDEYYQLIDGKAVPLWIVETVKRWYNQSKSNSFDFQEFVQKLVKLFKIGG